MEECKYVVIPFSHEIIISLSSNSHLADAIAYRQLIGNLLYLTISRPNISFIVNLMARFMQKPYAKQILRYVARNKDIALMYSKLPSFILSGFLDFDYGGDRDDRKSTFAYVFNIGSSAIS